MSFGSKIPDLDRGICLGNFSLIFFIRLASRNSAIGIPWILGSSGFGVVTVWVGVGGRAILTGVYQGIKVGGWGTLGLLEDMVGSREVAEL